MSARVIVTVELSGHRYDVVIEPGCVLQDFATQAKPYYAGYQSADEQTSRKVPFVADRATHRLFHETINAALGSEGYEADWFVVDPGEGAKSWAVLEKLTDWLLALGVTRKDHIFALGGGVVGDLTGFACAVTKRGCNFVQIPTTLLSQVDSSVGGKTAINTKAGKNLIGAFHQPTLVLADTGTLGTLPEREMHAGFAEVIKYGILGDADFFHWCKANAKAVIAHDPAAVREAVSQSVAAKARIVADDERELSGRRALLNLGHTFGHALEAEAGFSAELLHGEAVAIGTVLAARFSARRGEISRQDAERVANAIAESGLRSEVTSLGMNADGAKLVDHMRHDKKMEAGTLPFLLLKGIGEAYLAKDVELDDVAAFLDEELKREVQV